MRVYVVFFYGLTPADLAERLFCQRDGQAFGDVPSHCALLIREFPGLGDSDMVCEFVTTGFRLRYAALDEVKRAVPLDVPNTDALLAAINACRGYRYSWGEVLVAGLNRLLPKGHKVYYRAVRGEDCSCACLSWLAAGGVELDCGADPSPNDIKAALMSLTEAAHA